MENHGALVGWTHQDFGGKLLLCVESVRTLGDAVEHKPDVLRVVMTRKQAAVLGHFLMGISGETAPAARDRSWFRRLLG